MAGMSHIRPAHHSFSPNSRKEESERGGGCSSIARQGNRYSNTVRHDTRTSFLIGQRVRFQCLDFTMDHSSFAAAKKLTSAAEKDPPLACCHTQHTQTAACHSSHRVLYISNRSSSSSSSLRQHEEEQAERTQIPSQSQSQTSSIKSKKSWLIRIARETNFVHVTEHVSHFLRHECHLTVTCVMWYVSRDTSEKKIRFRNEVSISLPRAKRIRGLRLRLIRVGKELPQSEKPERASA